MDAGLPSSKLGKCGASGAMIDDRLIRNVTAFVIFYLRILFFLSLVNSIGKKTKSTYE
jgi:hypothetical protein